MLQSLSKIHDRTCWCTYIQRLFVGVLEIFHALKKILKGRGLETAVGDEGGFAPRFDGTEDGVETIIAAIEAAGYVPGKDVFIGLTVHHQNSTIKNVKFTITLNSKVKELLSVLLQNKSTTLKNW